MDMLKQQLIEWINYDLSFDADTASTHKPDDAALKQRLISVIQHTVRMTRVLGERVPCGLGESKAGGLPHLPPQLSWPYHQGRPLGFLAQLNLTQLSQLHIASGMLPKQGMLYFFMDLSADAIDPAHSLCVLFSEDMHEMAVRLMPSQVLGRLDEQQLCFNHDISYSLPCYVDGIKIHDDLLDEVYGLQNCTTIGHANPAEVAFGLLREKGVNTPYPWSLKQSHIQVGHLMGYPSNSRVYWQLQQQEMQRQLQQQSRAATNVLPFGSTDIHPEKMSDTQQFAFTLRAQQNTQQYGEFIQLAVFDGLWLGLGERSFHLAIRESDLQACAFDRMQLVIDPF